MVVVQVAGRVVVRMDGRGEEVGRVDRDRKVEEGVRRQDGWRESSGGEEASRRTFKNTPD